MRILSQSASCSLVSIPGALVEAREAADTDLMETPPAGWYRHVDHPGHERFWDGTQWLAHLRPSPADPEELTLEDYDMGYPGPDDGHQVETSRPEGVDAPVDAEGDARRADEDGVFGDLLVDESGDVVPTDTAALTLLKEQLHAVLDTLSDSEAEVISMRFGLTDGQLKTLDEMAKVYGVTPEQMQTHRAQGDEQAAPPEPLTSVAGLPRLTIHPSQT